MPWNTVTQRRVRANHNAEECSERKKYLFCLFPMTSVVWGEASRWGGGGGCPAVSQWRANNQNEWLDRVEGRQNRREAHRKHPMKTVAQNGFMRGACLNDVVHVVSALAGRDATPARAMECLGNANQASCSADRQRGLTPLLEQAEEPPPPLCDIPSGCCSFTGPWTVTRSSLLMLRRVAAFCRPLPPVLLLVSFPRSRSPVVGVLGLCCPPPPPNTLLPKPYHEDHELLRVPPCDDHIGAHRRGVVDARDILCTDAGRLSAGHCSQTRKAKATLSTGRGTMMLEKRMRTPPPAKHPPHIQLQPPWLRVFPSHRFQVGATAPHGQLRGQWPATGEDTLSGRSTDAAQR